MVSRVRLESRAVSRRGKPVQSLSIPTLILHGEYTENILART